MTTTGIRGAFFDFVDDPWKHVGRERDAARFHADGLLVIEDGRIADFGAFDAVARRHRGLAITHLEDRLILPGFIDGHIHFPQTRVIGAFGEQLLRQADRRAEGLRLLQENAALRERFFGVDDAQAKSARALISKWKAGATRVPTPTPSPSGTK